MSRRFCKHKLLLDENMSYRRFFPNLNRQYDLKHITEDFNKSGIGDPAVYELAIAQERLVITLNYRHFLPHLRKSTKSGVIGISGHLTEEQIDAKLVAFLKKTNPKSLYGAFHYISGETRS